MWIRARPASASISLEAQSSASDRSAATNEIVSFELLPTDERDHLDLDTGEMFQDYGYARIRKNEQKLIQARLTIRAIPDGAHEQQNTMLYMGEISGDDFYHASTIFFDVYVAPATFRELADHTRNGLLPETVTFELLRDRPFFRSSDEPEKKYALEFGWEPDGSGMIWHNKEDENKRIPIDSIRFDYAVVKPRYDEQLNYLLPVQSDAPADRISGQIALIMTLLVAVLKYLRWAMMGIVALAIMIAILLAKQRLPF
jgi:hypothetical protein